MNTQKTPTPKRPRWLPAVLGGTGVMCAEVLAWLGADLILVPSYFYVMGKILRRQAQEREEELS